MGKEKKKHKKKSSKHKSKRRHQSSSDGSTSSEEWVEFKPPPSTSSAPNQQTQVQEQDNNVDIQVHDEWMSNNTLLACVSRSELRQKKQKDTNEQDKYMLDKLGQTDRELNPYWKNGGTGLPEENSNTSESATASAEWLRKALQRAKEEARDTGHPLADIVAERWGSLEKLENMIAAAEERNREKNESYTRKPLNKQREHDKKYSNHSSDRNQHKRDKYEENFKNETSKKMFRKSNDVDEDLNVSEKNAAEFRKEKYKDQFKKKRDMEYKEEKRLKRVRNSSGSSDSSSKNTSNKHRGKNTYRSFSKPHNSSSDYSSEDEKRKRDKYSKHKREETSHKKLLKPSSSGSEDERETRPRNYYSNKFEEKCHQGNDRQSTKKKFVRPQHDSDEESNSNFSKMDKINSENYRSYSSSRGGWRKKVESQEEGKHLKINQDIQGTEIDLNTVSDEKEKKSVSEPQPVLTDKEMNELAAKLVKAELLGNQELADELKAKLEKAREAKTNAPKEAQSSQEVVILTHTDSKGFTRPVSLSGSHEPSGNRRKVKKVDTHAGGKRIRYFADDDKYSLQEMFQREKLNTVEDSNEVFAKLASKGIGRDDSARDMDDVFEETARMEEAEGRKQGKERQKAIEQSKKVAKTLDNCQWCLDSQQMLKHLIVAIGNTCYLCVPPYQSLTDNHCLIVPRGHTPCATQLDEDVWKEIQDFRKAIVAMFLSLDDDVIFFESARRLNHFPHMVLNCVPVPKETGDMAPIYFKKAIQECEMEWSNNKKLVDLRGRDVRKAVPRGLPYFAVDFGMDSGFAHVIEDEQLFPQNFAQEIIGGMLDLDHSVWRKQRRQTFEEQSKKVLQLGKLWSPFDITKKKS